MPTAAPRPAASVTSPAPRRPGGSRWLYLLLLSGWIAGCASLPGQVDRPVSTALETPAETRLGQIVEARAATTGPLEALREAGSRHVFGVQPNKDGRKQLLNS